MRIFLKIIIIALLVIFDINSILDKNHFAVIGFSVALIGWVAYFLKGYKPY